jgi:hypothetical protein
MARRIGLSPLGRQKRVVPELDSEDLGTLRAPMEERELRAMIDRRFPPSRISAAI